ncbi:MAG: RDD family protein [Nitrospira sp.]|nr:RDD family protein [Nitrospira sp.]
MTSNPENPCDDEDKLTPRIATFWRRIGAAVVDAFLLGAIGACLGFLWFDQLAALGRTGRFIGGAIALVYFGTLNSQIGQGQTLGKRLLKIRVTDAVGALISLPRSAFRATILLLPVALNGMPVPAGEHEQLWGIALSILIFGVSVAGVYLYFCNRRTRQSIHDLAVGTFVRNAESTSEIHEEIWKPHLAIAGGLCLAALGVVLMPYTSEQPEFMQQLVEVRRVVQSAVPDAAVSVQGGTTKASASTIGQTATSKIGIVVSLWGKPKKWR